MLPRAAIIITSWTIKIGRGSEQWYSSDVLIHPLYPENRALNIQLKDKWKIFVFLAHRLSFWMMITGMKWSLQDRYWTNTI